MASPHEVDAMLRTIAEKVREEIAKARPELGKRDLAPAWAPALSMLRARLLEAAADEVSEVVHEGVKWLTIAALAPGWTPPSPEREAELVRRLESRGERAAAARSEQAEIQAIHDRIRLARDACFAATTHEELAAGLRALRTFRETSRQHADIDAVLEGLERWPAIRADLEANPGALQIEVAERLDLSSAWLGLFTHRLAEAGGIRRETKKNRVRLWYSGETLDPALTSTKWTWLALPWIRPRAAS